MTITKEQIERLTREHLKLTIQYQETVQRLKKEKFDVSHLPYADAVRETNKRIQLISDSLAAYEKLVLFRKTMEILGIREEVCLIEFHNTIAKIA